jgi:hypothetical protein
MATVTRFWISKSSMQDKNDNDNYVRDTLHLVTSDRMTWTQIRRQSFMPSFGGEHTKEPGFFLEGMTPNHLKRNYWEVELEYVPFKASQPDPSPLARPAEVLWSTTLVDQPTDRDNKGRFICTTAGEGITGVMRKIPLVQYDVTKNLGADPAWMLTHFGALNSDTIKLRGISWKPGTLLLVSGSGGPFVNENKVQYTEIKFSLLGDARGWQTEVWNRGTVRLDLLDRATWVKQGGRLVLRMRKVWVPVPILSGNPPTPVDEPRFLDLDGQEVADAYSIGETNAVDKSKIISLTYHIQDWLSFGGVLPLT